MRSFIFAAGLFAATALASPLNLARRGGKEPCDEDAPPCMTMDQATVVAQNFRQSIKNYSNESTIEHFTEDFTDYSASVNTLINGGCVDGQADLNAATFVGREAFMAGQGSQPTIPFKILNLYHTCDTVIIRWRSQGPGQSPEPVTGIIVIEAEYQKSETDPWLIKTVYSEFNSGAWLVNLGLFTPTCPPPPPPSKRSIEGFSPVRMF